MTLPKPLVRYDFRKLNTDSKNYIVPFDNSDPKPTVTHSLKLRRLFQKYDTQENNNERIMSENFVEAGTFKEKTILDGIDDSLKSYDPSKTLDELLFANKSEKEYKPYCNTIKPIADINCFNTLYKTVKQDEETLTGPLKLENKYMYQIYNTERIDFDFSGGFTVSISFDLTGVDLTRYTSEGKRLQFYHLGNSENQIYFYNEKLYFYKKSSFEISIDLKTPKVIDLTTIKNITVKGEKKTVSSVDTYTIEMYLDYNLSLTQDITTEKIPDTEDYLYTKIFQNKKGNNFFNIGSSSMRHDKKGLMIAAGVFGGTILDFVIFTELVDINLIKCKNKFLELESRYEKLDQTHEKLKSVNKEISDSNILEEKIIELNYTLNLLNKKYQQLIQDQEKILANENQHAITLRASENVKNRIQRLRKQTKQLLLASQITHYVLIVIILLVLVYQIS